MNHIALNLNKFSQKQKKNQVKSPEIETLSHKMSPFVFIPTVIGTRIGFAFIKTSFSLSFSLSFIFIKITNSESFMFSNF